MPNAFFIADPNEISQMPMDQFHLNSYFKADAASLDAPAVGALAGLVRAYPGDLEPLHPEHSSQWIIPLSWEFAKALNSAAIDRPPVLAQQWMEDSAVKGHGLSQSSLERILNALKGLAQQATSNGKGLYLWISH